jgi:hypothetical protein
MHTIIKLEGKRTLGVAGKFILKYVLEIEDELDLSGSG